MPPKRGGRDAGAGGGISLQNAQQFNNREHGTSVNVWFDGRRNYISKVYILAKQWWTTFPGCLVLWHLKTFTRSSLQNRGRRSHVYCNSLFFAVTEAPTVAAAENRII